MTEIAIDGLKSRRAHSHTLDDLELSEYFDPIDFCDRFDRLNPDNRVWDSIQGESL